MTKEKKKNLYFDTEITNSKLKFLHESKSQGYELFNVLLNDGNSNYSPPFEKLATHTGQVFISEQKIEEIVNKIIDQRLRPSINNNKNDN